MFRLICFSVFLFFIYSTPNYSQDLDTDSLRAVLSESKGQTRINVLNELGTNLREISQEEAMSYSMEAEQLSIKLKNKSGEAKAKENIAWIYYRQGQWQKSFSYSEKAYELALQASDYGEAARILNNLGALYYEQQNFSMAIVQFKEAYRIAKSMDDLYTQIRSLNNVGYNFIQLGELDSALYYANTAIETNRNAGSPYLTAFTFRIIGDVNLAKNELDLAEAAFRKSLGFSEIQGILTLEASLLHRLGNTLLQKGNLVEAEEFLKRGIKLSSENSFLDELTKSHKYLAKVYEAEGKITAAFEEQSKYLSLNDSLLSQTNKDRLALLQGMFQDNLKKSELELLQAQNENQANRLQFINRIVWVISIAGILILMLSIWLVRLNKKKREQNIDLEQKSKELEKINQAKNKLFSILGHDLRSPIGQVKNCVDLLLAGELEKEEFEELIGNIKKDVDAVYLTLNNTLKWSLTQMEGFKLNKREIKYSDTVSSILALIKPQLEEKFIQIQSDFQNELPVMADADLIEVAVRNIITNAVKFSKPGDNLIIKSMALDSQVKLCITDHGVGMTKAQINHILSESISISDSKPGTLSEEGSGLGLQICKEFIKMNGGELSIESVPNQGTTVCVLLSKA
ncbi:tetratricopeptide repeat-containing sensor histidine kinase [Algoriphagus marinus]|uniref:tetratricopeptide repeat-containing sensor histidine kinase n=1 Tax=Algoriphagus marinus TaxID=1925762 RepID=UPI00094BB993|nr:tetratricopeptide repeat protein [Algoriphagus marinus]